MTRSRLIGLLIVVVGAASLAAGGVSPSPARAAGPEPDRQNGDLFVGSASVYDGYGNTAGGIWRVRGGTATLYCSSPDSSFDPDFWNVPDTVIVDSLGRIVFLAPIGGGNIGLLRCDALGAPAEKLALFHLRSTIPTGWPDPFPNLMLGVRTGYLHILRQRVISEDFSGKPEVNNEDLYEFVAQLESQPGDPTAVGPAELFRYGVDTHQWQHGHDLPDVPQPSGNLTSVVAHGDSLYMLNSSLLRMTSMPFQLTAAGTVGGTDFNLSLALFGGVHEVSTAAVDDTTVANVDSGCGDPLKIQPPHADGISLDMPAVNGGLAPLSADAVSYDEQGSLGLVLRTSYGPMPGPYLTHVSSALLNDDPNDDLSGYFHTGVPYCSHTPWVQFEPILPFWSSPPSGPAVSNSVDVIATAPGGMVGTQFWGNEVVRVTPGDHVTPIVSLYHPQGIAAYPAVIPSLGTIVYVTVHSPVDVLLTDADGRRIGVDPVTGSAVNDFGQDGYDTGAGEPRIFAIKNPHPGPYTLQTVGTGAGPYTIDVSSADLTTGQSDRIQTSGVTSPGDRSARSFTLASGSTLTFDAVAKADQAITFTSSPPAAVVGGAPYTVTATGGASGNPVTFSLDGSSAGCSLSGAVVGFTGAGTCKIDADQAGDANYNAAPQAQQSFTVAASSNTPPTISTIANRTINEDGSSGWLFFSVGDAESSAFSVTVRGSSSNTTVVPDANIDFLGFGPFRFVRVRPAANQFGVAVISVTVGDGSLTSSRAFRVTVNPVNDAPPFAKGPNQAVSKNSGTRTVAGRATAISAGPANESDQDLNFIVANTNHALFSAQPTVSPTGTLTFTPAPNARGSTTVTVRIHDNGGTTNGGVDTSAAQVFTIAVTSS